ncbi:MAG: VWA domain-containing protein [Pirellulaceae bacterium]|nr:VWA domain-containing protein [Pirellulaceae bacterium]
MTLGTPWMLLLLPPLALVGWLMARARRLQWDAACRLKGVAPESKPARLGRRDYLSLAALACTVLALARPQWNPRAFEVERRGRDLVIALDVSRSMLAADVFPSRLEAARIAIHEALPALAGQRIALLTFAGSASVRVPLTLDHGFVRYMLERADPADMAVGSTSLQAAFDKALGTVLTDAKGGQRDLVVFTDGEDHLSDIGKTAELLAKSGVRVLIIGLGDPVQGGRVPDPSSSNQWMRYKDAEVVSRLEEGTLAKLSENSPHVTYYPARTRPFDLVLLYHEMISRAAGDVVVGKLRQVRYTEGYPLLLGLAAALWLASSPWDWPAARSLMVLALLVPGCAGRVDDEGQAAFRAKFKRGGELLQYAQEQTAGDPSALRSLLLDAREEFLRAGLLRPGDIETARQITAITRRLREVEAAIETERAEDAKRREDLAKTIERLQILSVRQARLAQQSSQLLRRRLVPSTADLSNSGASDNEMNDDIATENSNNDRRLARPAATEQQAVQEGTASVLESVASQQNSLRQLLARAYGDTEKPPPTELDPAADLLAGAVALQQQALASLAPGSIRWPQANTAFHTAAGRMQQALETLRSLQPPATDQKDNTMPPMNDSDYDEDLDETGADTDGKKAQPVSADDFQTALALDSLPVPNYTPAEILAEEAANQLKRAKQKAARAGARVEKNW